MEFAHPKKRRTTLDPYTEEGNVLLLKFVNDLDRLFENFRLGTIEQGVIDSEMLRAENSGLIVAQLSGHGRLD